MKADDVVAEIFAELLGLDAADVRDDLTPEQVPLWDSLNHLRLVTALEEALEIRLSMADIESMMHSVGQLRAIIAQYAGTAAPAAGSDVGE